MTKTKNIFLLGALSLMGFSACDTSPEEEGGDTSENKINYENLAFESNEIPFKGGLIYLGEEGSSDEIYTVPEITLQKNDIKFRAKRIPSELYLKNKGVSGEELAAALTEVEGEQLFYFEFEEELKQDLIKKHLEDDLDGNISYLSFGIFNDFLLVNSKGDTVISDYSLYERNFHVAPYERLLVSFSGVEQDEELQLIYNDKLFQKGKLNFHFASTQYLENNIKNPS